MRQEENSQKCKSDSHPNTISNHRVPSQPFLDNVSSDAPSTSSAGGKRRLGAEKGASERRGRRSSAANLPVDRASPTEAAGPKEQNFRRQGFHGYCGSPVLFVVLFFLLNKFRLFFFSRSTDYFLRKIRIYFMAGLRIQEDVLTSPNLCLCLYE